MIIFNDFFQELLSCNRLSEISCKLNNYIPGMYELKKYTIFFGSYPLITNKLDNIYYFCQDNKVLVGKKLFRSLKSQGETLLNIAKSTLQIVKVSDINSKIIDAILFSIMLTIQILALDYDKDAGCVMYVLGIVTQVLTNQIVDKITKNKNVS